MPKEPNKPGMREKVHAGSKIRTPFQYAIADEHKHSGSKVKHDRGKAPKHNSGRY